MKLIEDQKLDLKLQDIEKHKNDSNRYHKVIKEIKNYKPKRPLIVKDENKKIVGSVTQKCAIITNYFKDFFSSNTDETTPKAVPRKLKTPFTEQEIQKATTSLNNNESPGIDEVCAEHLKYAPKIIHEEIAGLLNQTATSGDYPKQLKQGILTPIQKPVKEKGPPENLRPIILLSILRKVLAICLIQRCWDTLSTEIPLDQSAYQVGRSTTEQVAAVKLLAEKAISSSDYEIYILMLDMSKAFDTVNRKYLLNDLKKILPADEYHLFHILITETSLQIRVNNELGEEFITERGIAQGDCLSAVLFIYYLAKSLNQENQNEHNYAKKQEPVNYPELEDHNYARRTQNYFEIQPKFADDITWATTGKFRTVYIENTLPETLKRRDLEINKTKTEKHSVSRKTDDSWKDCKLLGTLLDTEKDINRRKALAWSSFNDLKSIFNSRKISIEIKIRTLQAYIASVFLYNCELWTLNKRLTERIDSFQRTLLRRTLGYRWPKIITNKDLYERTLATPWSLSIATRRLNWLGHLMRLDSETPVRKSLSEVLGKTKRPPGKPTYTWIQLIKDDLKLINIELNLNCEKETIKTLIVLTENRPKWRNNVRNIVMQRRR